MVEFDISIHPKQRLAYIPKEIFKVLGNHVKAVPNRAAVLIFSQDIQIKDVLKSIDIIKADLLHAQELREKESAKDGTQLKLPKKESSGAVEAG